MLQEHKEKKNNTEESQCISYNTESLIIIDRNKLITDFVLSI